MKPSVVADEMFPEGAGPYMDLEEVGTKGTKQTSNNRIKLALQLIN